MSTNTKLAVVTSPFDEIKHFDTNGNEYWSARELQNLLGYAKWQTFEDAIERAKIAAKNSGLGENGVMTQFTGASKMVDQGCGAQRKIKDYLLSRYACYLVAMNGDPRKEEIAAAQTYFAVKTREAEAQQIKRLTLAEQLFLQAQWNIETEKRLAEHDNKIMSLDSFVKDLKNDNATLSEALEKQQKQINRVAAKSKKIPEEYPPVNRVARRVIQSRVGALAKLVGKASGITIGEATNGIKRQIVEAFKDRFAIDLWQELEEAKKWYKYNYAILKAEDPNNVPADMLRPAEVKSLSLNAIISINKTWIDYFNWWINDMFEKYQQQIDANTGEKIETEVQEEIQRFCPLKF